MNDINTCSLCVYGDKLPLLEGQRHMSSVNSDGSLKTRFTGIQVCHTPINTCTHTHQAHFGTTKPLNSLK
ncbi:hypothetical protein SKAU_G00061370 [Synaphobranchus kaupii]|uniref:Uncharacterized protein n=1 Tax=Synaphobranchus kaupii TaxID=118154 RepID=A0A9Q1JAT4_SYNKA|nr:hypothetical protein SKAU_G00061370 [Synaphobranchus kaupii]